MARSKNSRWRVFLIVCFDGLLLIGFVAQAFLAACLLLYGYLPIPAAWANQVLAERMPEGIQLQVETVRLQHSQISLTGLTVHSTELEQALLSLKSVELSLQWSNPARLPELHELSAAGGTLYMPSIYAPSGQNTPLLERIALNVKRGESGWQMDRFGALHENGYLWGSVSLLDTLLTEATGTRARLSQFYRIAATLAKQKERLDFFETPTVTFDARPSRDGTVTISLHASSPKLMHPDVQAEQIQLQAKLRWDARHSDLSAIDSPTFSAAYLHAPSHQLAVSDAIIQIPHAQFAPFLRGEWPDFQLVGSQLNLPNYNIEAPVLELDTSQFPKIAFHGAVGGLGGAFDLAGEVDANEWSGAMHARGNIDLAELMPDAVRQKLPDFRFAAPPYYDLSLSFAPNLRLTDAKVRADIDKLQIGALQFDQVRAAGRYADGHYSIDELYFKRAQQWADLSFELERDSRDYRASLRGSIVPDDYNALLPKWWGAIFQDFNFDADSYAYGDFVINGNSAPDTTDLYYGYAEARRIAYRGVRADQAELIVRGRGAQTELDIIAAQTGEGWVRGAVAFSSKPDTIKGPASISLDLEARLTLEDAGRLLDGNVARLLKEFETETLPTIELQASLFNQDYPELKGKSHFTLQAACPAPFTFKGVQFDQVDFQLYGRSNTAYLRDLSFRYANGDGKGAIDIIQQTDQAPRLRYELELIDADQSLALGNLPPFGGISRGLQPESAAATEDKVSSQTVARFDLKLHGQGPADNVWGHRGFGRFEIRNERLATVQLLGPLSKLLQNTQLNYTSFKLNTMHGDFAYADEHIHFNPLQIDGLRTQIKAPGTLNLRDESIDMRVSVSLFGNAGNPDSKIRQLGDFIKRPIPNLLEFELSGTLHDQKFRSLYDPRNLIPNL